MIVLRGGEGKTAIVGFESRDTLEEIASVCRCTAKELAELMYYLYLNDWQGGAIHFEIDE